MSAKRRKGSYLAHAFAALAGKEDCPLALFGGELAAIMHYLKHDNDRAALVDMVRRYLFTEPGYSASVGEILGNAVNRDR